MREFGIFLGNYREVDMENCQVRRDMLPYAEQGDDLDPRFLPDFGQMPYGKTGEVAIPFMVVEDQGNALSHISPDSA
jgi:hypothetical protein